MTFYLKPVQFAASPNIIIQEGDAYFLKIFVDKIQRRIYKIKDEFLPRVIFNQPQQFISLTGAQYFVEIKLFKQDHYHNLTLIAQTHFRKQIIIREKQLQSKQNKQVVLCEFQLNPVQEDSSKGEKMTKNLSTYNIQIQVKLDKYKKVMGRMKNSTHFLQDLKYLDEDMQSLQRLSVHAASHPRPSFINKDRILPPDTKTSSTIDTKVGNLYIGSCYSKNMFSFLDRDNNQHSYSIVEPQYQN